MLGWKAAFFWNPFLTHVGFTKSAFDLSYISILAAKWYIPLPGVPAVSSCWGFSFRMSEVRHKLTHLGQLPELVLD